MVYVFKTNICPRNLSLVETVLNSLSDILDWNTDLEDSDNILRVVSDEEIGNLVVECLEKNYISCQEL